MPDLQHKHRIAERMAAFADIPVLKSGLSIEGGEFSEHLQSDAELTTGRFDTRFSGPDMDTLSTEAEYDPQPAAISSAYVTTFNDYVREILLFGANEIHKPEVKIDHPNFGHW